MWNKRESKLVEDGPEAITLGGCLHTRPLGVQTCRGMPLMVKLVQGGIQ